ncbi:PCYCGC domain-containing protein [Halalkalibacter sp. APA_J-10(15)]|uniref:PCYCGC domain-containing protein n=1 Tax=Halalkalibacter sp. APA_J-10(15) TaxID=2933805 RepID=UPI001FF2176C|nr:PCYCGC domain-containing protein [Halalkalibacter sp. APA_J-10(15)]MCK0471161.1 PCYCGC domain-containing protein [Halalkalibacter sp. APA_J-10(15)]
MKKIFIGFALAFLLLGCTDGEETEKASPHNGHQINGDLREETAAEELPQFLDHYSDTIADIYSRAVHYEDVLVHIPCYCGCGEFVGHRHTYDCFIYEREEESVVWDDHGAKCGVCLEIAHMSMVLTDQGLSVDEIRQIVDDVYQQGYPEPTPTPVL